jgi:hypothetical protein
MVRSLAVVGIVMVLVGAGGFVGYYPVFGRDSAHLSTREMTVNNKFVYDGYKLGDRITIFGKITDMGYSTLTGSTSIQLDGIKVGWLDSGISVGGDLRSRFAVGDSVELKAYLDDMLLGAVQFWHVPTLDDVRPMIFMQGIFGALAVVGFVAALAGMRSPRGAVPARPR